MQMKMVKQLNKKELLELLTAENDFITNLMNTFDVPETIDDDEELNLYLSNNFKKPNRKKVPKPQKKGFLSSPLTPEEEATTEARKLNKIKEKKVGVRGLQKNKKDKERKKLKKTLVSALKAQKNEKIKEEKIQEDKKNIVKLEEKPKSEFNKEGKIVFSKVEIPLRGSKFDRPKNKKKSAKDKIEKNPIKLIKKLKAQDVEIKELVKAGDTEKAAEMKKDIAWKKVFDKTEGKTVKDNPELIMKGLRQRRAGKKKSKKEWKGRKEKVEKGISDRQKKRQQNIDKKIQEKKTKKLKTLSKRGRVIAGY